MIKKGKKKIQPSVGADRLNSPLSRRRNSKSCDRPPRHGHVGNIWTKTGFRLLIAAFLASDWSDAAEIESRRRIPSPLICCGCMRRQFGRGEI